MHYNAIAREEPVPTSTEPRLGEIIVLLGSANPGRSFVYKYNPSQPAHTEGIHSLIVIHSPVAEFLAGLAGTLEHDGRITYFRDTKSGQRCKLLSFPAQTEFRVTGLVP